MISKNFITLNHMTAWDWNQNNSLFHIYDLENSSFQPQIIAEDLSIPWAVEVSEDGRLFFTERGGNLRVVEYGVLNPVPVHAFGTPFVSSGEGGLMGLALDKDFLSNGYIYLMYTYEENVGLFNRVVRMRVEGNAASEEVILLDRIPAGQSHIGGRLKIGPDGYLYITTGDAGDRNLSQDINSLAGKILRIGTDGSIPTDNPFPGSVVYALGLRNPQGLAWNNNNVLYASDHGERAHDEINIILPGGNYGWPLVTGDEEIQGYDFIKPVLQSGDDTWAPAGITFVTDGPLMGQLLVATLRGNELLSVTFDETGTQVAHVERLLENDYGRLRDVYQAMDGSIYLNTSNMDGRGLPNPGDDKIIRL
jgi:glucose/arabinose dehydrogenase